MLRQQIYMVLSPLINTLKKFKLKNWCHPVYFEACNTVLWYMLGRRQIFSNIETTLTCIILCTCTTTRIVNIHRKNKLSMKSVTCTFCAAFLMLYEETGMLAGKEEQTVSKRRCTHSFSAGVSKFSLWQKAARCLCNSLFIFLIWHYATSG